ncbi:MAG TPA: DEAD/DEAH box helicase [Kofleriaceae bacterium]|nr:DEAD/DEAH box helicase [Kofleriaceae bacterium]
MPFPSAHPGLLRALTERGYAEPTPVQAAVLDPGTTGRDLLVSAETGSGKTVAYGLLMAQTLLDGAPRLPARSPTLALVIAPTRELAVQVQAELGWLYAPTRTRVVACVGGMDPRREQRELAEGAPIVVGTPGRLRDHLERGRLDLSQIAVVVLDEADEMLDLGFKEELEALLQATPATRRTLMFSATIPRTIAALARQYQVDAVRISTTDEHAAHGDIEYRAVTVLPRERDLAVVNLLRYFEVRGALVFCSTRAGVNHLAANLLERGFAVVALSGELSQAERTRALQSLRDGRARVCVATDVAARGLDLPDLGLVIHADPPRDRQTLLHRSGRTGRAGRKGTTVLIVPATARSVAERMLGSAGVHTIWSPPPSSDEIRARDQARLTAEVESLSGDAGDDERAAAAAILAERTPEQIATALVRLHRGLQPAPEELTIPVERPTRAGRPEREPRRPSKGDWALFRLNIGSTRNADPRWLIPLLCKRGGITRHEIGAIRISFRDTTVEIATKVAAEFAAQAERPSSDPRDKHIRIEPHRGRGESAPRRT